jgi:hypothetical protein
MINTIFLDMVWPATYILLNYYNFWFIIFGTILIETMTIKLFLKFNFLKSLLVSSIANIISGTIGTIVLTLIMIIWHMLIDKFVGGTFNLFNWSATFIIMFVGSVVIEILFVKIFFKIKFKQLILPLIIGNVLTYIFIALILIYQPFDSENKKVNEMQNDIFYEPNKTIINSNNCGIIRIKSAFVENKLNNRYKMTINFEKDSQNNYISVFELANSSDESFPSLPEENKQYLYLQNKLKDTIVVYVGQRIKNDTVWIKPQRLDTIKFTRIKKQM